MKCSYFFFNALFLKTFTPSFLHQTASITPFLVFRQNKQPAYFILPNASRPHLSSPGKCQSFRPDFSGTHPIFSAPLPQILPIQYLPRRNPFFRRRPCQHATILYGLRTILLLVTINSFYHTWREKEMKKTIFNTGCFSSCFYIIAFL